jgi:hypothetical protein
MFAVDRSFFVATSTHTRLPMAAMPGYLLAAIDADLSDTLEPHAVHQDRGHPGRNFLSINKERLLIDLLGPLSTPETVQDEVLRKARQDERFRAAAAVWRKLTPKWVQILSDDQTPELAAVVHRITRQPLEERLNTRKTWARQWSSHMRSSPPNPAGQ